MNSCKKMERNVCVCECICIVGLELVSTLEDRHQRNIILDYRQLSHFLVLLLWKAKLHLGRIM